MKFIIVAALISVLVALASAGVFMLRKSSDDAPARDKRMARALAVRVGLSIALFVFILVAWKVGWISPSGIPTGR
ncbi:MAG: twin transmembrane helix small protein [Burkholderiaceae bacterium]|nr:twin transmembrane helix small protein [Burkholderiaceae bacterium]